MKKIARVAVLIVMLAVLIFWGTEVYSKQSWQTGGRGKCKKRGHGQ